MAEYNKEKYYWFKLKDDFFKRHDIKIIKSMPNGKDYVIFYLQLLCESLSHNGKLRFNEEIPYSEEMLSVITDTNIDVVRSAMKLFEQLKLVEIMDDQTIFMTKLQSMIGSTTIGAEKKQIQRITEQNKMKAIEENPNYIKLPELKVCKRVDSSRIILPNGKLLNIDEKRYGGNAGLLLDLANGKCEDCGSEENIRIHHENGYSNNLEDLVVLCSVCHGKHHKSSYVPKKYYRGGQKGDCCPPDIDIEKDKEIDIYKYIKEKECIEKDTTPFDAFISKYSINVDNYSAMITEMDFNLLDKAFSESNWLCENYVSLSRICKDYEKIVGGYYKDFVKPKEEKQSLTDAEFLIAKGFSKEWVMALSEEERAEKRKKWE